MSIITKKITLFVTTCLLNLGWTYAADLANSKDDQMPSTRTVYIDDNSYTPSNSDSMSCGFKTSNQAANDLRDDIQQAYEHAKGKPSAFLTRLAKINNGFFSFVMNDNGHWIGATLTDSSGRVEVYGWSLAAEPDKEIILKGFKVLTENNKNYGLIKKKNIMVNAAEEILKEHGYQAGFSIEFKDIYQLQLQEGQPDSIVKGFYLIELQPLQNNTDFKSLLKELQSIKRVAVKADIALNSSPLEEASEAVEPLTPQPPRTESKLKVKPVAPKPQRISLKTLISESGPDKLSVIQSDFCKLGEDITCTKRFWEILSKDDACALCLIEKLKTAGALSHVDAIVSSLSSTACRLAITKKGETRSKSHIVKF